MGLDFLHNFLGDLPDERFYNKPEAERVVLRVLYHHNQFEAIFHF